MIRTGIFCLMGCIVLVSSGCATTVNRMEPNEVRDLSGRWNDTDSRLVSEEMIKDSLLRPWLRKFEERSKGKPPVVVVGRVRNRTHEHISVETFVKDLERALLNSGEVEFVAGREDRWEVRRERMEQTEFASEETAKAWGKEVGADFMLTGVIISISDRSGGRVVRFYQVTMELIELETNKKVWIGDKKIKKYVHQSRYSL